MNKAEKQQVQKLVDFGCLICYLFHDCYSPAGFHHIHGDDNRRIADHVGFGICFNHHQSQICCEEFVSRHPHKRKFIERYGEELPLYYRALELTNQKGIPWST